MSGRNAYNGFVQHTPGEIDSTQLVRDSETKIIRWFRYYHPDTGYTGKLVIFSERNPCGICSQAIIDLKNEYKNLEVYVLTGGATGKIP